MTTPPRRRRIDTIAAAVDVARAAGSNIVPPAHVPLSDADQPFWRSIVGEMAKVDWTEHQLEVAALLARSMCDLEREQGLLRTEGGTIAGAQGGVITNPRKAVTQMHTAAVLALRRSLSLHARGQGGEARGVGKRREISKAVERGASTDSGLIARPKGSA